MPRLPSSVCPAKRDPRFQALRMGDRLVLDPLLIVAAEMLDARQDRLDRAFAERTEALALHGLADVKQQVDVFRLALAMHQTLIDLIQPRGTLAAGRALAAG